MRMNNRTASSRVMRSDVAKLLYEHSCDSSNRNEGDMCHLSSHNVLVLSNKCIFDMFHSIGCVESDTRSQIPLTYDPLSHVTQHEPPRVTPTQ
jgi:hypothetical protein